MTDKSHLMIVSQGLSLAAITYVGKGGDFGILSSITVTGPNMSCLIMARRRVTQSRYIRSLVKETNCKNTPEESGCIHRIFYNNSNDCLIKMSAVRSSYRLCNNEADATKA